MRLESCLRHLGVLVLLLGASIRRNEFHIMGKFILQFLLFVINLGSIRLLSANKGEILQNTLASSLIHFAVP